MNKRGLIAGILVVIILLVLGFIIFQYAVAKKGTEQKTEIVKEQTSTVVVSAAGKTTEVEISNAGFSPQRVTIQQGDGVKWVNQGNTAAWPASAIHPTHRVYPGSDIAKCGSAEEKSIFDACKGISQGESYQFTFNEKGTWNYHDHLHIAHSGSITVN